MDLLARTLERKRLREPPPDLVPSEVSEDICGDYSAPAEPNLAIAPACFGHPPHAPILKIVNGWKLKQFKNGKGEMRQV